MKIAQIGTMLALSITGATSALASTVAVIDSGTDYKHKDLAKVFWHNPGETADNGQDDDGNGYVDDVYGWNVAEKSKDVIDYSFLGTFSADCEKYFQIQSKVLLGTATTDEKQWMTDKKNDANFITELQTFGNFVHGSHTAGISSTSRSTERVVAIKLIPTKQPGIGEIVLSADQIAKARDIILHDDDSDNPLAAILIQFLLGGQVDQLVGLLNDAGAYATKAGADVANGSFGSSTKALEPAIRQLLSTILGHEPSEAAVKKYTAQLVNDILEKSKAFVEAAPSTLFVFAAGNDGTDNDSEPVSPANIKLDNVITVAATLGFDKLASFSNYGATMVDVAAPGVAINSTIPGDKWLTMSGTSMAAPYVTEIAALVKDANPALKPVEMKRVLTDTVDKKDWLSGKVRSGGVVNSKRAVEAARLSKSMSLDQAISQAKTAVGNNVDTFHFVESLDDSFITPVALPSPIH